MAATDHSIRKDNANFVIRETPDAGRAVFASTRLVAGTPIISTDLIPAHVILTEYKKEVCAHCFEYNRGRTLKFRDVRAGLYFCSSACQIDWRATSSRLAIESWEALATFLQKKSKVGAKGPADNDDPVTDAPRRPSQRAITKAWERVEATAHFVRKARQGSTMKPHRTAVQAALAMAPSHRHLSHLLSGCLTKATDEKSWRQVVDLAPDETPYRSPEDLQSHIHAYLQLVATMPLPLLEYIQASTCHEIIQRDSHNAFGIRSLDDNGSEFFGFGVWPEASYFNHSCNPNVSKKRVGRQWEFWVNQEVEEGGELNISYLGGDENELDVIERRKRTKAIWSFECVCRKCLEEAAEAEESCNRAVETNGTAAST